MSAHAGQLRLRTGGDGEIVNVTNGVAAVVRTGTIELGVVTVFARGSTAAVTTMEYEPGGVADLRGVLERLLPAAPADGGEYRHNVLNWDTNAHAHLRAALVGPSVTVPLVAGELQLGTWQQIVLLDFDDRPRERVVLVHVTG